VKAGEFAVVFGVTEHRLDRFLAFSVSLVAEVTREHAAHE
jgi:hypothetical protein